jgi:molecular chaperone DnaK
VRAAIKEHGGKVPGQIGQIEAALSDLEKVMKGDDKDAIESRTTALEQAAQSLAAAAAAGQPGPGEAGAQPGASAKKDDVVDAEFTEVKDDK